MIEAVPPPVNNNAIHLKHRHTGETIWRGGARSVGMALHLLSHSGARLRGVDLRGMDLSRTVLNGIRIPDADLTGADLSHSLVTQADLRGCVMQRVNAIGTNFSNSNLSGVDLERATLLQTKFHFAELTEARCELLEAISADFSQATLRQVNFRGASLWMSKFVCAEMEDACLTDTELKDCDFTKAELSGANLRGCAITLQQLQSAGFDRAGRELFDVLFSSPRAAWALRGAIQNRTTQPTLLETVLMADNLAVEHAPRPLNFWPIEILWQAMREPPRGQAESPIAELLVEWIDAWHARLAGAFDGQPWPPKPSWPVATIHDQASLDAARM